MGTRPSSDAKLPLLLIGGLSKSFGPAPGLSGINFEVREREIHGLLGADGAGKSTLCRIVAGHLAFDDGEITYRGYSIRLRSIRDALRIGIALVTQASSLAPDLTVLENIFLPSLGRAGRLDVANLRKLGHDLLSSFGRADQLSLDSEVGRLSASERQIVEICKALAVRAKLIVFDEPTATLEARETGLLFDLMTRLRLGGRGLVFASHRPEEILAIADRVSVLRDGRMILEGVPAASLTAADARAAMRGSSARGLMRPGLVQASRVGQPPVLDVRDLAAPPAVRDVTFSVRAGETVGLGGIVGAGRSEVLEAILGLRPRAGGAILLDGRALPAERPRAAVAAGLRFAGEDRGARNIWPDLSVGDNIRPGRRGRGRGSADDAEVLGWLGLADPKFAALPIGDLGPGVQQRVVIARCLLDTPRLVILDEPTRGVDLATRSMIHAALRAATARGTALLLVASDADELLEVSDRIVVMSDGRTVADLLSHRLDAATLALLAAPRAALDRNTALLEDITAENGGVGFWAWIENGQVVCLNAVVADPGADPGFKAGEALDLEATRIPEALRRRSGDFVRESGADRHTMLVPLLGARGADLGFVGLSLTGAASLPPPAAVKFRVDMLAAQL